MSVIGFLKHFGLDKDFKLNIEPNHTTLAGHSYEHDIIMASVYDALDHSVPFVKRFDAVCWFTPLCVFCVWCRFGMLGSVDANTGSPDLGWDTDQFPMDIRNTTLVMKVT